MRLVHISITTPSPKLPGRPQTGNRFWQLKLAAALLLLGSLVTGLLLAVVILGSFIAAGLLIITAIAGVAVLCRRLLGRVRRDARISRTRSF
jgi:protein-S-isoprenylcysteine O-methyltransferase Ste14